MSVLRIVAVGGLLSYRALFSWARPALYIPTLLGSPLFQILFFAYVGRSAGVRSDSFFVVGNAVQVSAMSGVYGMAMAIGGERFTGTLSAILSSPANRAALFLGRTLPYLVNGMVVSAFGFGVGTLLLDFHPPARTVPALALAVAVSSASCTALGAALGALALRARDVLVGANVVYFLMLLFCGVNVPLSELPGWMAAIGRSLPLTHGIQAARRIAAGEPVPWRLVATESAIGVAYAVVAYGLFRVFEAEARRRATLELL
jgi:ABC-2 type transport system permease protein